MPYITREDGERFIIPSYRDILSAKKPSLLKREIMLLSQNYGEYINLQKKSASQFEITFSPDPGYLLGECVWNYFKRPYDMIFCEAIANSNDAILVIVKSGSVYLDGSFSLDTIAEELVIFKTQQNNFSIYISGDVPISETPEEGKFSFESSSVRSFQRLDTPIFPTLPIVKAFQLQLVDAALKAYGIGVFPVKKIVLSLAVLAAILIGYVFITSHPKEAEIIAVVSAPSNPYLNYQSDLNTPDPATEIASLSSAINFLYTIPGWKPDRVSYLPGQPATARVHYLSMGGRLNVLTDWCNKYNEKFELLPDGVYITIFIYDPRRNIPTTINKLQDVIASILDRLSYVLPGNVLTFGVFTSKRTYSEAQLHINLDDVPPFQFDLVGKSLANLPLVLTSMEINLSNVSISGTINLKALGN
jgi:hypothetical protein